MVIPKQLELVEAHCKDEYREHTIGVVKRVDRRDRRCSVGFLTDTAGRNGVIELSVEDCISLVCIRRVITEPEEIMELLDLPVVETARSGKLLLVPTDTLVPGARIRKCAECGRPTRHSITNIGTIEERRGFTWFQSCCLANGCYPLLACQFRHDLKEVVTKEVARC